MTLGIKQATALLAASASLILAPAALASGGVNSGGGGTSTGGGSTTGTTTSGGGTSTGGTGGGGRVCSIVSLSNSVGYYSSFAAIWTSFSITGCPNGTSWRMDFHNDTTGNVDFSAGGSMTTRGGGASGTIDEDWAAFSTPYTVTLTATDPGGNPLTSRSAAATTPDAKPAGA
ncbi:MAG: hypothetical protein JWM31_1320 [Solirubrobacterales bacterium]|nr:hypothetical protein [Solirubrobacterales bacterium]